MPPGKGIRSIPLVQVRKNLSLASRNIVNSKNYFLHIPIRICCFNQYINGLSLKELIIIFRAFYGAGWRFGCILLVQVYIFCFVSAKIFQYIY